MGLGNPLVGIAIFGVSLYDYKASDSVLNRVLTQTYKIEGTTNDPKVNFVRPFDFKEVFR